jgi:hypothetical protein
MPSRRMLLPLVLSAALATLTAACGEPPDREIQQAKDAIAAAKAAGADVYARDEFTAAEQALQHASEAVAQRDYRLALSNALDAREHAQNATREAADRKTAARADAERTIAATSAALAEARARLRAAEAARVSPKVLAEARRSIGNVDQTLQKARTAQTNGDYVTALDSAKAAMSRLQAVAHDLEAASTAAARRRR